MYNVSDYGRMIGDKGRVDAYLAALKAAISSDSVVLDLGAGTGFFSLAACHFGAKKVYAIDVSPAIELLPDLARRNGFEGRISVHRGDAFHFTPPEPINVIISDLRGNLPLHGRALDLLARFRGLLAPGGTLLPHRDTLHAALVTAPRLRLESVTGYATPPLPFDLAPALTAAANEYQNDRRSRFRADQCVSKHVQFASIDYATALRTAVRGTATFELEQDAVADGLCVWFNAEIAPGIGFSNAPGEDHVYSRAYFAWPEAVELNKGDAVSVALFAQPTADDYLWGWTTSINGAVQFRQSNPFPGT